MFALILQTCGVEHEAIERAFEKTFCLKKAQTMKQNEGRLLKSKKLVEFKHVTKNQTQ